MKCSEKPDFKSKPHKIIRGMLSELLFKCKNCENGCIDPIPYDKLEEHEKDKCEYEMLTCPGKHEGCKVQLIKKEMNEHEAQCQFVPIACEFCKKMVRRSGMEAHLMYCEEAEVSCEFCNGIFKRKNYLIHVSAVCEEYIMNCGRCSGTYKRKFKEFHDCVRHLQNCLKTTSEEISNLKKLINEKDKKISELEQRVFFEIVDLKKIVNQLQDENLAVHSKIDSMSESNTLIHSDNYQQYNTNITEDCILIWDIINAKHFSFSLNCKEAILNIDEITQDVKQDNLIFGFVHSQTVLDFTKHSRCLIGLQIEQNITTNFNPMYFIVGIITSNCLNSITNDPSTNLNSFEQLYSLLSPTCIFIPSLGKTFKDKMQFIIKKITMISTNNNPTTQQTENDDDCIVMIEELEKNQKQKVTVNAKDCYVFFGVYCNESNHLSNYKDVRVKIY